MSFDPLAPAPPSEQGPGALAGAVPCKRCGRPIDPATALYDEQGERVCVACSAAEQVALSEGRVIATLRSAAYGAALIGVGSLCFNPFLIPSILAISGGAGVLTSLGRNPHYRGKLGGHHGFVVAASVAAIVLGLANPVLRLLGAVALTTLSAPR